MNQRLDASLAQFAGRPLAEAFPYLILELRAGSAGAAAFAAASLTAAARGALPDGRSGRRDGHFRSNKGMPILT
jgi:hypothetical protein